MVSDRYQESATVSTSASAEQPQDGDPHLQQAVIHLARIAGEQHDSDRVAVALHGFRHGHQQAVVFGPADIGRHFPALIGAGHPELLTHIRLPIDPGPWMDLDDANRRPVRQPGHDPVVDRPHPAQQRPAGCRRRQRLHGHRAALALAHAAVGDHLAVRRIELGVRIGGGLGEPAQQRARQIGDQPRVVAVAVAHRALAQRPRIDPRLLAERGDLSLQ